MIPCFIAEQIRAQMFCIKNFDAFQDLMGCLRFFRKRNEKIRRGWVV